MMVDNVIILNVDDQDAERYIKSRDLRQAGFTVLEARTGAEALRATEQQQPAVVLLDVHLPDFSGYEVCKYIKRRWPGVMILMTSATFTTSADRTLGLDSGADSFLVQPAEPLELAAAINALLRIRGSEDALRRLNETLEQRVKDRVAELREANEALTAEMQHRQEAEAALVQAGKMQALGQLTGGLAHDFNNLLTAVVGNLDRIRHHSGDARVRKYADNALTAAQRGAKLTSQLLAFSRTQQLNIAPVDVNALLAGMQNLLSQSLGAGIAIRLELAASIPAALADANQLELAILNLAINARDAMPQGGALTIATSCAGEGPVTIAVTDTGYGMPPEVAARAFDPFYTTKPAGKGTGLGLSQVYGTITQCGGSVTLDSHPDRGTTIRLHLRPVDADAIDDRRPDPSIVPPGQSEKVLVVDDDADVRDFLVKFLSEIGYRVDEAAGGDDAAQAIENFAPDLIVLDFAMPGSNGAEVAIAIRKTHARIPILFISGFADSEVLERAVGTAPLLRKPFQPAQLAVAVRTALSTRPGASA